MRRTDQEFKSEILRRKGEHRRRQKRQLRAAAAVSVCLLLVIFGSAMSVPFFFGMGAGAAPEAAGAPEAPAAQAADTNESMEYGMSQIRAVMVEGQLYLDTGLNNGEIRKCGTFDGEITSQVDRSQLPKENDQSNFGTGWGYQYGALEGTVEVYMNENWRIFATEEAMASIQFPE